VAREDLLGEALERAQAAKMFVQGEVLKLSDLCVVLADAEWPLSKSSAAAAETLNQSEGVILVPEAVDLAVILTQTCDLQETDEDARLCQLAPLVERDSAFANEAQRGRRPGWAAVPWYSDTHVADLSRLTSVERSLIIGAESFGRPETVQEQAHFADSVSRHFTRVALANSICDVLAPFLKRMKERHDRVSDEGRCISMIPLGGIRVEGDPSLEHDPVALRLLIVLEPRDLPSLSAGIEVSQEGIDALVSQGHEAAAKAALDTTDPRKCREGWDALVELWTRDSAEKINDISGVDGLDTEVLSGDEMTFTRLRRAPELDLAYLSTRAV